MLEFEKATGKNAVYRGAITGNFEFWLSKREKIEVTPIEKPIQEEIDIFPAKFLKVNQNLLEAINKLFSYRVSFLNPEAENSKGKNFNKIIIETTCPACKSILHCTDCFKKRTLRVTYMRICHKCGVIFIFTCKYEKEEEFKEIYDFFVEHIYKKRGGDKKNE